MILENRPQLDIQQIATGEHWLGQRAFDLKLIDDIQTSDDYLLEQSKHASIYGISYEFKKSFLAKLSASAMLLFEKILCNRIQWP